MWGYRNRLDRDVTRWREAGYIDAAAERAIRADIKANSHTVGLASVLAVLAAILIGFAAMSFVAANWQVMPKILRLGMLIGLLWAAYMFAAALFSRSATAFDGDPRSGGGASLAAFGHAAVLLGTAIFGASIMLISQMYHMDGNPPDLVLTWGAAGLLAGVLFVSNPALAFALVLFSVWGVWETGQRSEIFWPYLAPWAATAAAFAWHRWPPGAHLAGLGLAGFIVTLGYIWHDKGGHELVVLIGLALTALGAVLLKFVPKLEIVARPTITYALVVTYAGLFALQFVQSPTLGAFIALAVFALLLTLAAIWWGLAAPDRLALWLGYIGFSIEILAIYGKTIGTLMGSSLFFLTVGLIVAGLAYLAYRLHNRQQPQEVIP